MLTSRRALIAVLVATAVAGAMAGCGGSAAPAAPASRANVGGSWPVAGNDIGDTRDAAGEHIIGPHNVSRLTTAWSVTTAGSVRAPTVDGGVVYFPDSGGKLWAVSAATGKVLWSHEVSSYIGIAGAGFVTTANGLVYAGSTARNGDDMYVLDAATGTILWRFASGGPVVSGAAIAGGSVYWGSGYRIATRCPNGKTAIKVCTGSNHKIYAFRLART